MPVFINIQYWFGKKSILNLVLHLSRIIFQRNTRFKPGFYAGFLFTGAGRHPVIFSEIDLNPVLCPVPGRVTPGRRRSQPWSQPCLQLAYRFFFSPEYVFT